MRYILMIMLCTTLCACTNNNNNIPDIEGKSITTNRNDSIAASTKNNNIVVDNKDDIIVASTKYDNLIVNNNDSIVLIEQKYDNHTDCECEKQVFKQDTNIYFLSCKSTRIDKFEGHSYCFKINILIYGHNISLDSVYFNTIQNKDILYMHGFSDGIYKLVGDRVILKLWFINSKINSSRPTDHLYTITYNRKSNKKPKIKLYFPYD